VVLEGRSKIYAAVVNGLRSEAFNFGNRVQVPAAVLERRCMMTNDITCPVCGKTDNYSVSADTIYHTYGYAGESYGGVEVRCYSCKSQIIKLIPDEIEAIIIEAFRRGLIDELNTY